MMDVRPGIRCMTQRLADVPGHNGWLTLGELDVLASKKILKRRADWRLGRWTAKQTLRTQRDHGDAPDENDIEIRAAADGAPEAFLNGRRMPGALSLSHSNGVALCAVAEAANAHGAAADAEPAADAGRAAGREAAADVDTAAGREAAADADTAAGIGCDIELIEERSDAFVADYFAETERALVHDTRSSQRPLVTTLLWSAKESVLKALREGLRRDPRDVAVSVSLDKRRDEWAVFTARCRNTGETFDGWWRVHDTYVQTIARRSC